MNASLAAPNRRILVIDDNRSIHDDFRKILGSPPAAEAELNAAEASLLGTVPRPTFEIDTATQGEEGVQLAGQAAAQGRPYALAFVDMRMPPGWDGIETTRHLWRVCPELQAVICTAYSDTPWEQMLEKLQPQDRLLILKKPFEAIEVQQLASALVEKSRLRREAGIKLGDLEQAVRQRTRDLEESQTAALNMMEDAVESRDRTEQVNTALRSEIAAHQQAQEALAKSEKHYRALIERAQDGISLLGPEGKVTYASPSTLRILGINPDEALGLDPKESMHPDDLGPFLAQITALLQQPGGSFTTQYRFKHQTGSWRWLESTISNLFAEPAVGAIVFNYRDITERKQIELELRQSEERYRLLFERNPLPMWLCDAQTLRFLAVNESAVQQYGYTREEFLAMTIEGIRPPEEIPALHRILEEAPSATPRVYESRHRRKDGTIIHAEVVARPLVFEGREARLVLAADVTEKKQLEQKFLQAQRLESLGMLAAGITHDLNNVLAPIVFAAPLLRTRLTDPRDVRILETLENSAARGTGLVKQILGFVRTTAGEFQPVQAKHLLRDIVSLIEETFPKAIQCEHHIPTDLWPILSNATQIHQVLLNLCVNARDAMPNGGTLSIRASNRRLDAAEASGIAGASPGAWLLIEVGDTGTGIAPEVLEKIWLPFFTTKGPGRGTGLGLSTVRGIVASHHGLVELDTKVGRGTTFRVWLPALENDTAMASGASPAELPRGHGELILVVEDDAAVREIVEISLKDNGYRVLACQDGLEALDTFMANPNGIALVLTDVDMPRMGGMAMVQTMLSIRPDIPLIAMSGLSRNAAGQSDVPEIRKLTQAFLTKPYKNADLLETVHRLLPPSTRESAQPFPPANRV